MMARSNSAIVAPGTTTQGVSATTWNTSRTPTIVPSQSPPRTQLQSVAERQGWKVGRWVGWASRRQVSGLGWPAAKRLLTLQGEQQLATQQRHLPGEPDVAEAQRPRLGHKQTRQPEEDGTPVVVLQEENVLSVVAALLHQMVQVGLPGGVAVSARQCSAGAVQAKIQIL